MENSMADSNMIDIETRVQEIYQNIFEDAFT